MFNNLLVYRTGLMNVIRSDTVVTTGFCRLRDNKLPKVIGLPPFGRTLISYWGNDEQL